jgi:lactate dehydrogenase-like 2-hydroxyacid dehydrogenase
MMQSHVLLLPDLPTEVVVPIVERYAVIDWRDGKRPETGKLHSIEALACSSKAVVDDALLSAMPKLRLISSYSAGLDGIDLEAAARRGVEVACTAEVLADDVADLAMALVISVTRRIGAGERYLRAGRWAREGYMPLADSVQRKTMGIVGLGTIGSRIARRATAFGLEVLYHTREPRGSGYVYVDNVQDLARRSDYLVLACPLTRETRGLINSKVLEELGGNGYLINVARGAIVVEVDLVAALESGRIAGAALDVFQDEPAIPKALLMRDDVVMTPHIGSATTATRAAMAEMTVNRIVKLLG